MFGLKLFTHNIRKQILRKSYEKKRDPPKILAPSSSYKVRIDSFIAS